MLPWSRPLFTPASVHARLCSRSQRREPLSNGDVTEADIDGLSLFRFSEHPKLKPKIWVRRGCPSLRVCVCVC